MATLDARTVRWRIRPGRGLWLVVPAVATLLVFFLYPLADIASRSITEPDLGLSNYAEVFQNDRYRAVLLRTMRMAGTATLICLALGFSYAYLMTLVGPRKRLLLLGTVLMPYWTSVMVRTYSWYVLMQDNGPINDLLGSLGLPTLSLIRRPVGVTVAMTQLMLPYMILILYAAMARIDRRYLSAARSLGARPWTAFRTVYLPLAMPGVVAACTLVFVLSLGFYLAPVILGSPREAMLSQVVFEQVALRLDWGEGAALGIVLLVVTLSLAGVGQVMSRLLMNGASDE